MIAYSAHTPRHAAWWVGMLSFVGWLAAVVLLIAVGSRKASGAESWAPDHDVVQRAWGWAFGCTSHSSYPSVGRLDQVVWMPFAFGARVVNGTKVKGEWVAPDTIYVAREWADSVWVLAHEMVHHKLGGPPGADKHPTNPFLFPCQLMPIQNAVNLR